MEKRATDDAAEKRYADSMLSDWLRSALEHANISQADLARRLSERLGRSIDRAAVNKMLLDPAIAGKKARKIAGDELLAIAEITGFAPPTEGVLSAETMPPQPEPPQPPVGLVQETRLVPVPEVGVAEAGAFRAVEEYDDEDKPVIYEAPDPAFPDARMVAFRVAGDSMNDLRPRPILDGDRVVCVDWMDLKDRVVLRDGMVVVVEQTRDGGHTREWSVKQIELYEDRTEFCPRSTNKRHKPIVIPREFNPDDGREVRILALVRRISNELPL